MESLEGRGGRYREPMRPDEHDVDMKVSWQEHDAWVRSQPEYREGVKQIDTLLDSVSFTTLHDIFEQETRRAQIECPMFWVNRDHIYLSAYDNADFAASYHPDSGTIQIGIDKSEHQNNIDTEPKRLLFALHLMIHEYTHAVSGQDTVERTSWRKKEHIVNTGFARKHRVERLWFIPKYKNVFDLFNEGVTETMAREVTLEYLARQPLSVDSLTINAQEARRRFAEKPQSRESPGGYHSAAQFVQSFLLFLEKNLSVPKDVVWSSIKRGFLRGTFIEGEFAALLDKTVGRGFTSALARAKEKEDLEALADYYDFPTLSNELTKEWLSALGR